MWISFLGGGGGGIIQPTTVHHLAHKESHPSPMQNIFIPSQHPQKSQCI